ncbi:hypothetical protein I3843_01G136700 [Carya illinoinensis]|uniref:Uncharacterized protein n=1 Tax=Carya illinoinensis TaxID=32201 RepID=A0A922G5L5_CARIL|nr:hypothetical protein I3760_01G140800 [Carya illinoinensis]KAG6731726.1 hypothetical protein I3842_01G143900 [Carya illinoinensis]KAG7995963.1 hypothetical protein I3843_01G136700 [Carya illinoinensis]
MASQPQADKLVKVGLEGFAIIDKVYGARPRRYGYWLPPPPPPTHAYHHGKNINIHLQEIMMSEVPAQMKEAHHVTKNNMQSGNNIIRGQNSPVMIIYSEAKYF